MSRRTRLSKVCATVMAAMLGSVVLSGGSALAAKPEFAGPPMKTRIPLAEGAPTFLCDERSISVTGGQFMDRFRLLPGGRFLGQTVALGGVGEDEQGNAYKVRVSGRFTGSETDFESRLKVVLIGRGEVYKVQIRFSTEGEQITGDCEVAFPEPEPEPLD